MASLNHDKLTLILSCVPSRRVKTLIEKGGTVVHGGKSDESERYIDPTILTNVKASDAIMQEEVMYYGTLFCWFLFVIWLSLSAVS